MMDLPEQILTFNTLQVAVSRDFWQVFFCLKVLPGPRAHMNSQKRFRELFVREDIKILSLQFFTIVLLQIISFERKKIILRKY